MSQRLQKINNIRNFGLFRNFIWDASILGSFDRYNLIYGWNYTGKTTLSRIFQAIEDDFIHRDFSGGIFEIEQFDGTLLSLPLTTNRPLIKIFNREFVNRNFRQTSDMTGANAITVIGEANQVLKNRLEKFQKRVLKLNLFKNNLNTSKLLIQNALGNAATNQARIVNQLVGGPYNRTHFNNDVNALPVGYTPLPLTLQNLSEVKERFRRAGDFSAVSVYALSFPNFFYIVFKIRSLLKQVAINRAMDELRGKQLLEQWVQNGIDFNASAEACKFCGNIVSENRWNEIKEHFSKAFSDLQNQLKSCRKQLLDIKLHSPSIQASALSPNLRDQFTQVFQEVECYLEEVQNEILATVALLNSKLEDLALSLEWRPNLKPVFSLRQGIQELNGIIEIHNDSVRSADEVRNQARKSICQHFAVDYIKENLTLKRKDEITNLESRIFEVDRVIRSLEEKISLIEQAIRDASIGVQKINENLAILLPNDNVVGIKLNDSDFEFQRNGFPAKNMSEGERTAVAFSYFLATLEDGGTMLSDAIIVIDDPISSLDENHIYAVHAIVEGRLSNANQLIVLTHNSNFFSLTKDWMKNRNGKFFMTERSRDASGVAISKIVSLPRMLKKFKSPYQYSYYLLKVVNENPSPSFESLHSVPNTVRAVLEAYLGFVFPESGGWGDKLPKIFASEEVCRKIKKFADENSHAHSLSQATEIAAYTVHCKEVVAEVLDAINSHSPDHVASMETEFLREAAHLP